MSIFKIPTLMIYVYFVKYLIKIRLKPISVAFEGLLIPCKNKDRKNFKFYF